MKINKFPFSYPLLNVPLPGNVPTAINFPLNSDHLRQSTDPGCADNKCTSSKLLHTFSV